MKREHFDAWSRSPHKPFEDNFVPDPNSGCWLWLGHWDADGYGRLRDNLKGHHASYVIHKGDIPEGLHVCHTCDTRCCVNPDHLFLGTNLDNTMDKVRKGRTPKWQDASRSLLTNAQVLCIKDDGRNYREIALSYGVSETFIHNILSGKTWKNLTKDRL